MNISYRKEIESSYMVIEGFDSFSEKEFAIKMLLSNSIKSLLRFHYESINNKVLLIYDISNKQSFRKLTEIRKMNYKNLRQFVYSLKSLSAELEEYLLSTGGVILKPECIYGNPEGDKYFYCYYPHYQGDFHSDLLELFSELLSSIDYADEQGVKAAYELHRIVTGDNFTIGELVKVFDKQRKAEASKIAFFNENITEEETNNSIGNLRQDRSERTLFRDKGDSEIMQDLFQKTGDHRENEEELSFFKKANLYLKGKGLIDVLEDINNGELMDKINNCGIPKSTESYRIDKPENAKAVNLTEGRWEAEEITNFGSMEGTVLLGSAWDATRCLVGIGSQLGHNIRIDKYPFTIGKTGEKGVEILNAPTVSRMHARLYWEEKENQYYIEDLNSKNGTFLNNQPLDAYSKYILKQGDVVAFAREEFSFK